MKASPRSSATGGQPMAIMGALVDTEVTTDADLSFAKRRAAQMLASLVGCDVQTASKALVDVDSVRGARLRQELRKHLAQVRAFLPR